MKLLKLSVFSQANLLVLALSLPVVSQAQEFSGTLEEVTVTAQKRPQSLQDVPISVNVVSGEKISEAGIAKIEDLQAFVPNLTMSETGIGTNIYIRGIGSGINQGFEQSVGMYVDGVYSGRAQLTRAPFLDLSRIEVMRGPQNILFGKNSIAGALNLITAEPTDEFEGSLSLTLEPQYGEEIFDLMLSGPISENLSGRLAHRSRTADGYIENIDGGDEPERDEQTTRLTLRWDAGGAMDATLKYEQSKFDVVGRQVEIVGDEPSLIPALGGANWSQFLLSLNPLNTVTGASQTSTSVLNTELDFDRSSNGDYSENDTDNLTLTVNYAYEDLIFTSVTGLLGYEYEELCDCDFSSANIFFVQSEEEYSQFSQEFRVTSPLGETIEWIGGLYYQDSDLDFDDSFFTTEDSILGNVLDNILPAAFATDPMDVAGTTVYPAMAAQQLNDFSVPRVFRQDSEIWSAFVQATWNISDVARLTAGGRYSTEDKEASRTLTFADGSGAELPYDESFIPGTSMGPDYLVPAVLRAARHDVAGERTESNFAPMVNVEYDIAEDAMAYATWSRGFKAGGYDVRSNVPPVPFEPDGTQIPTVIENPFSSALDVEVPIGSFDYDEEKAETIELGLKTRLLDGSAELNLAAFYTNYEDLQVSIFDGVLGFNVGNAGEAVTQGIEADGRWAVTDNITLGGSLAWLDFEFKDYENGQCTQLVRITTGQSLCDYEGQTNQYVADFSGALSAEYVRDISDELMFSSSIDMMFTTDYNPSQNLDPNIDQNGFTKFNLRLALSDFDERWEIALLGKNITDEEVITYANDMPLAANLIESVGYYAFIEPPRTVAVQGTYRF